MTIGSHTHTHRLLDRVDGPEAAAELDRSVGLIEDRLGVGLPALRLPQGAVRLAGGGAGGAAAFPDGRPRRDPAEPVRPDRPVPHCPLTDSGERRHALVSPEGGRGSALEDDLRTLRNRRRYAGTVT